MALCNNMHRDLATRRGPTRRDPWHVSSRLNRRFHEREFSQWKKSCPSDFVKQLSMRQRNQALIQSMLLGQLASAVGHLVEAEQCPEVADMGVQCNLDDMLEPMYPLPLYQRKAKDKIMRVHWQDPQESYVVDGHFQRFEDAETLCMWVGQLPDDEISRLAGRFCGCKELGGQPLKRPLSTGPLRMRGKECGRVSNRHVAEACMLAEVLPVFRRTLLFSIRDCLQSLKSEKAAVAACDFIMQLIQAQVLPGALVAEMLTVVAVWPACIRVGLPSFFSEQECDQDQPFQRTQTVRAAMPEAEGTPSSIHNQDLFQTQSELPRTQSEPTPVCERIEDLPPLIRSQSDPGCKSYSTANTSLRPHEPHVRFAKEVVLRVESFETNVVVEVDVNLHEALDNRWSHKLHAKTRSRARLSGGENISHLRRMSFWKPSAQRVPVARSALRSSHQTVKWW